MAFGPSGRDHDSQTQLHLISGRPRYFNKFKKNYQLIFEAYYLETHHVEILRFEDFGKDRGPDNPEDPPSQSLQILKLVSVFIKNHEMGFVNLFATSKIRNFYLPCTESPHPTTFRLPHLHQPPSWGTRVVMAFPG